MRARKALGQHFLTHAPLLARIAAVTLAGPGDVVLEIGPGRGALTQALLDRGATVVAIERDGRVIPELARKFAGTALVLIEGDALELDWPSLVAPWVANGMRWRIVGNIPYNITSPLLGKALQAPFPATVTYLVQQEVADRIVAAAGADDYGALTVGIQAVADPVREFTIPAGAFTPAPKVDSAVLHLVPRATPLVDSARLGDFRKLVTSLFSYRRKRMHKALREATGLGADDATRLLAAAGIDADVRPEIVTPEGFARLLHAMDAGR